MSSDIVNVFVHLDDDETPIRFTFTFIPNVEYCDDLVYVGDIERVQYAVFERHMVRYVSVGAISYGGVPLT